MKSNWSLQKHRRVTNVVLAILCTSVVYVGYQKSCLQRDHISRHSKEDTACGGQPCQVPNIVHYIWYNNKSTEFRFHHMLSVMSAHRNLKPDVIYVYTNNEPHGKYWDIAKGISSVKLIHRQTPTVRFGEKIKKPKYETSDSNVDKVIVLSEMGGIYLDFDILVIRSMDELRKYECTIGFQSADSVCAGAIISSKTSAFLYMWINSYLDDYRDGWAYNSGVVPYKLWKRYPHLVHVEEKTIHRPNYNELDKIIGPKKYDWRKNYAVHLWPRLWSRSPHYNGIEPNENNIKNSDTTFAEISRTILEYMFKEYNIRL